MIQEGLTMMVTIEKIFERKEGERHADNQGQSDLERGTSICKTEPDNFRKENELADTAQR